MEEVQAQVEVAGLSSAIRDDKVIEGKNGRLFLANDSNDVFRQHAGELCLTEEQLEAWEALLERRRSALANRGSQYLFAIAPDAHSVYPDELPDWVGTAARRPVHQLMDRAGLPVPLVYPLEDLVAERANWPVYPRTSSHWDDFGGFLAYRRLCRAVVDLPMRELSPTEIAFGELVLSLDLGVKMTPPRASSHVEAFVLDRTARLVLDNCVENTGSMIVTECLAAPASKCILFGDSYAEALLKFLAESFRRFVFAHSPTVDLELVERERPNLVVSLMAERFLIQVPDDAGAPSLVERERAKRKAGTVRRKIEIGRASCRERV